MNKILAMVILIAAIAAGCTQPPSPEPGWKVETVSAECGTGGDDELDIRAAGNSIVITVPMQTSTPCYNAAGEVTIDGTSILVEISAESQGGICIECIGRVVGRVTVYGLSSGSYSVDVRAPDKAAITTVMIE